MTSAELVCPHPLGRLVILAVGFAVTLGFSGVLVRHFTGGARSRPKSGEAGATETPRPYDAHALIGKCENILTLVFVLMGEFTGLALILAAKSLVRAPEIHEDAGFYLGGTLVNLVWGICMGLLMRWFLIGDLVAVTSSQ